MALTDIATWDSRQADRVSVPIADTEVIYKGAYVAINTAGYAVNIADTTGFEPLGVVLSFDEQNTDQETVTGDTSASVVPTVDVDIAMRVARKMSVTGATAQTNVGELVYATDENTFTTSATSNIPAIGTIVKFHSSTVVDVLLYSHEQMRGN
jgi:hypothetical protein